MIEPILLVVLGFFILVSVIDWKFKAVPSVLMTGMLLIVAVVNVENLSYGILAYIFAILLKDLDVSRGIADTKATVIIGLMISDFQMFAGYLILLSLVQFVYTVGFKTVYPDEKEFPFLPVYLIVYAVLLFSGVIL